MTLTYKIAASFALYNIQRKIGRRSRGGEGQIPQNAVKGTLISVSPNFLLVSCICAMVLWFNAITAFSCESDNKHMSL